MADASTIDNELSKAPPVINIENGQDLNPQLQSFISNVVLETANYNGFLPNDLLKLHVGIKKLGNLVGRFSHDSNQPSLVIDETFIKSLDARLATDTQVVESNSRESVKSPRDLAILVMTIAHEQKHFDQDLKGRLTSSKPRLGSMLGGEMNKPKKLTGSDYIYDPLEVEARKSSVGFLKFLKDKLIKQGQRTSVESLLLMGIDQIVKEQEAQEKEFEEKKNDQIFRVKLDIDYGDKIDLQP